MNLSDDEITSLAGVLSRRLGPDWTPFDPTDAASRGPAFHAQWERRLRRANANRTLPRLIRTAARVCPNDPVLLEASALVAPVRAPSDRRTMFFLATSAAALLFTAASSLATTIALASTASRDPAVSTITAPATHRGESVSWSASTADVGVSGLRADGKPGDPSSAASSSANGAVDGCARGGWVYAGGERPVGTFVAPTGLYVREAPRGAKVGCTLPKGASVPVDDLAVRAAGDHFWVYVASGRVGARERWDADRS